MKSPTLWVPFEETCRIIVTISENIKKLLGGKLSFRNTNVQLEMKVRNARNIENSGQRTCKSFVMILFSYYVYRLAKL